MACDQVLDVCERIVIDLFINGESYAASKAKTMGVRLEVVRGSCPSTWYQVQFWIVSTF